MTKSAGMLRLFSTFFLFHFVFVFFKIPLMQLLIIKIKKEITLEKWSKENGSYITIISSSYAILFKLEIFANV
jgi:hypothetical protein